MNKTLTPIIVVIVAIGLFFWQIKPLYSEITELRNQGAKYDEALKVADEVKQLQADLAQKYEKIDPVALERIETFLPNHLDTVRLILDINGIAANYNIAPKDIKTTESASTGAPAAGKLYNTGTVSFTFTAPYLDVVDFMKDIEASLRLIDVQSVSITPNKGKGPGGYSVAVVLNTYWLARK